jgi:AraC-like DNA-binding protein
MSDIELNKYSPINPVLKKLIKFYWTIMSKNEKTIHGKLIPTNNIDLIINLSKPIKYENRTKEHLFQNAHFSGIQNNHRIITQKGPLDVVGISFQPTGFYPLIKVPLSEFANNMIPIENLISGFERKVERIAEAESIGQRISVIEETLVDIIDLKLLPEKNLDLITNDFLFNADNITIHDYCKKHGINQKKIERFFLKYIGTTPKAFIMTTKFQQAIKSLMIGEYVSMTELGYAFNYYDQTHFINSFKSFSGKTPYKQLKENDLIINYYK